MTTGDPMEPGLPGNAAASESAPKLRADSLPATQLFAASIANIGPAIGVVFYYGLIVAAAGLAAPFAYIIAGIGFLFHVNTSAQFSRAIPSAGSYANFIGRTFGRMAGPSTGVFYALALLLIYGGWYGVVGDWVSISIMAWFGVSVPWWICSIVVVGVCAFLCIRGVIMSTGVAAIMFAVEVAILLAASGLMLAHNHSYISWAPFDPRNLTRGVLGLGLAFPIMIFSMIGASASVPLAEEASRPRRSIPIAVYSATGIAVALFVITIYATIVGFQNNIAAMTKPALPFVAGSSRYMGGWSFLLYLSGFTSVIAVTICGVNASSRVLYSISRTGALPKFMSTIHPSWRTPWLDTLIIAVIPMVITLVVGSVVGVVNEFGYVSTLATAIYVVMLMMANVALPFYYWMQRRRDFNVLVHVVAPILGLFAFGYPLWLTLTPAQPAPYSYFWIIVVVVAIFSFMYGTFLRSRGAASAHAVAEEEEVSAHE